MPVDSTEAILELEQDAMLGEGPVWDVRNEKLYWVDILNGKLFVFEPDKREQVEYEMGEHLGALALREGEGAVLALKSGFALYDFEKEQITHLSDPEPDLPGNRFNDGKCDPSGRFWAGTMSYELDHGAGSLYCLNTRLVYDLKLRTLTIPNGMAWNEDGDRMYFIDTVPGEIYVFDYDNKRAAISNRSLVARIPESEGYPDGMTIDEEGYLWVALYGGGKVIRIDPAGGETVFEVDVPVPKPTSCTFGGSRLDQLFITTARENMSEEEVAQYPLSGSLFKAALPFQGMPPHRFGG